MQTVRENISHIPCDICCRSEHKVLYFAPTHIEHIDDESDWLNMCPECYQDNCLKDSDEGLKLVQATKLPETIVSALHAECPSCGIVHDVKHDADSRFGCFGCGTPLIIESCFL
jgi:hypothetical protein